VSGRAPPALPTLQPGQLCEWHGAHVLVLPLAEGAASAAAPAYEGFEGSASTPRRRKAPLWLGPNEAAIYRAFPYEPRAAEWLAGRRTAKALLRAVYDLAPEEVEILPEPTDAPMVHVDGQRRPDLRLSLSHTLTYAAAAIAEQPVGVDLCDLADGRRIRRIAQRVLSEGEAEATGALESEARGALVWALKEAGLKVDVGGIFTPGAKAIRVLSLDPVRLANPGLEAAAWWLPLGTLGLALRST
jgi:phosphopantetheinyl transferase